MNKRYFAPRTCTSDKNRDSEPITTFRDEMAYVLLGDPGMGKTEAFSREAKDTGGFYVRARDFVIPGLVPIPKGSTIFIDGLDEMPEASDDIRKPFDRIRERLIALGRPKFRLSCREADWLGNSAKESLKPVSPDGKVDVLHLDPLDDAAIRNILEHHPDVHDVSAFLRNAEHHRLTEILRNPQMLLLLIDATKNGHWPDSRKDIFDLACRKLAEETNPEHAQAARKTVCPVDTLLNAAGYLCALHLISGISGFALDATEANDQYPCYLEVPKHNNLPLLQALKSKLFHKEGPGWAPTHRTIAEFLAGRYISGLLNNGQLPIGRVLALISGVDGGVVPDLKGLAAWLAVWSPKIRNELITREPLGIVLYGDAKGFPNQEKIALLYTFEKLAKEFPWFRSEDWSSSPFGALGTPDMQETFRDILASPRRDAAHQALLDCVLEAIRHGMHMPDDMLASVEEIVRDESYFPAIRKTALNAMIRQLEAKNRALKQLTQDLRANRIADEDDELLGILLHHLYPEQISANEIVDYLHLPKDDHFLGSYRWFWEHELLQKTDDASIPDILDQLAAKQPLSKEGIRHDFRSMTGELLARGLEKFGESIAAERLFEWLGLAVDRYGDTRLEPKHQERIGAWLARHEEHCKALIEVMARKCTREQDARMCMYTAFGRLPGLPAKEVMFEWLLEKAAAENIPEIARFFFEQATRYLARIQKSHYLSLAAIEEMEPWIEKHPKFRQWYEPLVSCPVKGWEREHAMRKQEWKSKEERKRAERLAFYRQHIEEIRHATAHPRLLLDLALAYKGFWPEARGDTPKQRLQSFLDNDEALIKAANEGLRRSLERDDLPGIKEIVDLAIKGRIHPIQPACLVGMELLAQADPKGVTKLDDELLLRMLVFRLADGTDNDPAWFKTIAITRPGLMAQAIIEYALPLMRARKEHIHGLDAMAHDETYVEVARLALPRLLKSFPVRANAKQLSFILRYLLRAALRYMDRNALLSMLRQKLSLKSMDKAQRIYWLACGLLLDPAEYQTPLYEFVHNSQKRRAYLGGFLHEVDCSALPPEILAMLISLLAPDCSPERPKGAHWVGPAEQTAELVHSWINVLGGSPDTAAMQAIEQLLADPNITPWHNTLRGAKHAQRITRRKTMFTRPTLQQTALTLINAQPANAADLAALVFEHLCDIRRKIEDGNTNDYRQYWSYDASNRKLCKPKPEEDCRDALLSDLKERLAPLDIDAQPEGRYADEKRSDIRVSFGGARGFNVPIEIKKDSHPDLWTAIHKQLIAKYARDPDSQGNGIYLVFWFGGKGMKPPPDGHKIQSARELEERLRATLSTPENNLIRAIVIDCSLRN